MDTFPKGFLWGASTSAYQVEGGNSFSDWWGWEKRAGLTESGEACRHYHLYREDFETAAALSHNCHRLSLEWGRIEPVKGGYSGEAISHYRQVIRSLKELGLEPVVTLNHFTLPQWFAQEGGWLAPGAPGSFLRYVERMVRELGGEVRYWVTLNEPMVFIYHGYVLGIWPPQERSLLRALRAGQRLAAVHARAYRLIHRLYAAGGLGKVQVSIAHNMQAFVTCTPSLKNKAAASLRDRLFNFWFLDRLMRMRTLDFIGLNYYTRGLVDVRGWPSPAAEERPGLGHISPRAASLAYRAVAEVSPARIHTRERHLHARRLPALGIYQRAPSLRPARDAGGGKGHRLSPLVAHGQF